MIWFFERGPFRVSYEVRCAPDGPGYEAVVTRPDGSARIVRADHLRQLLDTSVSVLLQLREEGWARVEPRLGSRFAAAGTTRPREAGRP
jgi:hypothetical protein